jgi:ABC-2 type transport system permease protein
MRWIQISALAVKEFLVLLRDPRSRFLLIVPPIVQLFLFGYAANYDVNHVPYVIYDEDRGAAASALAARFAGSPAFHLIGYAQTLEEARAAIDRGDILLALHIGPRFSADILAGSAPQVQIIVDGRRSNVAQVALGYALTIVNRFSADWRDFGDYQGRAGEVVSRAWFNPNYISQWFIVPGLVGILMLLITLMITALSVARERELGTLDQLLVTPLYPTEILMGKVIPPLVVGCGQAVLVCLLAVAWFGVPLRGSLAVLTLGLFLFLLSAIGVGLMISSLSRTQQQAVLGVFLFMVPAVILSGFSTPISSMPESIQALTLINPLRYVMVILRGVFLRGSQFGDLFGQLWPLALIAVVTLALSQWLFRRKLA